MEEFNENELVKEIIENIEQSFQRRGLVMAYQRNVDVPRSIREIVFYTMRANGYMIKMEEGRRA